MLAFLLNIEAKEHASWGRIFPAISDPVIVSGLQEGPEPTQVSAS